MELIANLLGQGQGRFFFAMGDEDLLRRRGEVPQPAEQRGAVGVAGKPLDPPDLGLHPPQAAVQADLAAAVEDLPP